MAARLDPVRIQNPNPILFLFPTEDAVKGFFGRKAPEPEPAETREGLSRG
jgi:hypothetical protein